MKILSTVLFALLFSTGLLAQGGIPKDYLKKIESIMAPLRLKVESTLKKENKALFASYQNDMKKLSAITDSKQQKLEMERFNAKYYAYVKAGYAKANIDEATVKKNINQLLSDLKYYKITYGEFLSVKGFYFMPANPTTTGGCVELKCPMDVKNTTMSQNNLAFGGPETGDCYAYASALTAFILNMETITALGKRTMIEKDMARVDLSCPLNYYLNGMAFAILGGSYCDASVGLKITGPNVDTRIEFISGWALAPIIWYNEFEETGENNFMECNFIPSANGGNYTIQGFAKSFAVAGLFSGTTGRAVIRDFSPIKVCQVKK